VTPIMPGQPAKILLVDDRHDNLVALEAMLQGLPVQAVTADSGDAALKQLLKGDFALILLDAHMPGMDGFETAAHIKSRERTRQIPIIFLTAADRDARLALRGYAAGAVDYITKPFDPWVLRAKVSVLVEMYLKSEHIGVQARQLAQMAESIGEALAVLAERPPHEAVALATEILQTAIQDPDAV
jgi:CheY-like chemotaxis protein